MCISIQVKLAESVIMLNGVREGTECKGMKKLGDDRGVVYLDCGNNTIAYIYKQSLNKDGRGSSYL